MSHFCSWERRLCLGDCNPSHFLVHRSKINSSLSQEAFLEKQPKSQSQLSWTTRLLNCSLIFKLISYQCQNRCQHCSINTFTLLLKNSSVISGWLNLFGRQEQPLKLQPQWCSSPTAGRDFAVEFLISVSLCLKPNAASLGDLLFIFNFRFIFEKKKQSIHSDYQNINLSV